MIGGDDLYLDKIITTAIETLLYHYTNYMSIEQSKSIVQNFSYENILVFAKGSNIKDFINAFHKRHLETIILKNLEYPNIKPLCEFFFK